MAGDAIETEATDVREMEIAHLDLRYAHTRILKREHLVSLAASIEQWGQIIPVVTVTPCVLIDGYRRVAALKLCKRDTVLAEHWSCGEEEAVFRVLRHGCERRWDVVEQAALIRELIECHKMSRARVAHQLGKTPSWVTRRLDLLHALPLEVLTEVKAGRLSSWAASRVLAPLARANTDHAAALGRWVGREHVSTRELADFFDHYQSASAVTRERMVADPSLFRKALRTQREKEQADRLRAGPEGRWLSDLLEVVATLRRLNRLASGAPYPGHKDRARAILGLEAASGLIETLQCGIRSHHDCERLERGCPDPVSQRHEDPPDQHDPQGIEEHRSIDPARQG
jgi:ParB family transcriptional regulator, chromosome partitioning protein